MQIRALKKAISPLLHEHVRCREPALPWLSKGLGFRGLGFGGLGFRVWLLGCLGLQGLENLEGIWRLI